MARTKQFLGSTKKSSMQKDTSPITADEFLVAGVDHEEAGEKWRAGDAAKSSRFFVRALEAYQAGIERFPRDFDLAYNKARLQYDIAQQPKLLDQLPVSLIDLLNTALESHRYALGINQDNADLLFNTAQVLTTLTEVSTERRFIGNARDHVLRSLQEALGFFQRCLSLQEDQLDQNNGLETSTAVSPSETHDLNSGMNRDYGPEISQEEVWASIEEPVTNDSIIDTVLAQLGTLTTVCTLLGAHGDDSIRWIEEYYRGTLQERIDLLSNNSERLEEILLTKAKFMVAFADASFHGGAIDLMTYEREINAAFPQDFALGHNEQGLCDRAEARMTFNTSIIASKQANANISAADYSRHHSIRWVHITKALDDLTTATKLPQPGNLPRMHLRRGDCELMRYGLSREEFPHELAAKSAPTLMNNAEVYYRGAAKLAQSLGAAEEEREALVKEAAMTKLLGDPQKLKSLIDRDRESTVEILKDMQDECLLSSVDLAQLDK